MEEPLRILEVASLSSQNGWLAKLNACELNVLNGYFERGQILCEELEQEFNLAPTPDENDGRGACLLVIRAKLELGRGNHELALQLLDRQEQISQLSDAAMHTLRNCEFPAVRSYHL